MPTFLGGFQKGLKKLMEDKVYHYQSYMDNICTTSRLVVVEEGVCLPFPLGDFREAAAFGKRDGELDESSLAWSSRAFLGFL